MLLSVITINRNNIDGLKKTLSSVINQSERAHFEFIVVDGASTDGGSALLREYSNQIDKWISEPDSGIYQAMNKGVQMASGDYCVFMNSGDTFHDRDTVRDVLGHLQGEDLILGNMQIADTGFVRKVPQPLTLLGLYHDSIPHNAAFIRRDLLLNNPYDESLKIVSDWKFFLQAIIFGDASCVVLDKVLCLFDANGISSKNRDLVEAERQKVREELFPKRLLQDYFQFCNGAGYQGGNYDRFYVKLRDYRSARFLYALNVRLLRILSYFKKSARWVRFFPLTLPKDNN